MVMAIVIVTVMLMMTVTVTDGDGANLILQVIQFTHRNVSHVGNNVVNVT